jgi:hypothetical protein
VKAAERQLDGFIAKYDPKIASMARKAFAKLRAIVPHATILVYDNYNALAIGFCPNERASNAILSLALFPRWVRLFFLQGAGLPDPHGLLGGTGKKVRSRILVGPEDLDQPEMRALISTALERAKVPIDAANACRVIIKAVAKTQRPRRQAPKKGRR